MKALIAAILAATLTGCAGSYYDQMRRGGGQQAPMTQYQRDRLECENQGLAASGPGAVGLWNQVQVERNCMLLRGYK